MKIVLLELVCIICFTCVELRKHHHPNNNNNNYRLQQYRYPGMVSFSPKPVHLRHSRYPNLEHVYTRLNQIAVAGTSATSPGADKPITTATMKTTTIATITDRSHSHRQSKPPHRQQSDDEWLDQYDDDDDDVEENHDNGEENLPDYDQWGEEDNLENDYDDEYDDNEEKTEVQKDNRRWQAEEATENSPSSLTEYKWQHYGTRTRVEESRRSQNYLEHSKSYAESAAALEHSIRINKEGRCKEPLPKIVSVQSVHPDPGKTFIPHCTILFRCAEDTGCCSNHATSCGPKKQTKVYLYFYTTTLSKQQNKVEKLEFLNHTECGCLDKSSQPVEDMFMETTLSESSSRPVRFNVRAAGTPFSDLPETIRTCKCPEEYTPQIRRGLHCSCDCLEGNVDCSLIKKGKEFFSLKDRLCILNKQCGLPSCEYGAYMRNIGRCPRKQEKLDAFASVRGD